MKVYVVVQCDCSGSAVFFALYLLAPTETNMPYHPCLFFVKVEVGRKKKAEDVSDVKLLLFEADGVDAC